MSAWGDNDWRVIPAQVFVKAAKDRALHPGNKNALNRLIHELAIDMSLDEPVRQLFRKITLQAPRAQTIFVTGAVHRYWETTVPNIGLSTPVVPEIEAPPIPVIAQIPTIPEPAPKLAAKSVPSPVPVVPQKVPMSVLKQRPCEFVISLKLDNTYDCAQILGILSDWVQTQFAGSTVELLESRLAGQWHDLRVRTDRPYSLLRGKLMQIGWVVDCVSKPMSDFGQYWACV